MYRKELFFSPFVPPQSFRFESEYSFSLRYSRSPLSMDSITLKIFGKQSRFWDCTHIIGKRTFYILINFLLVYIQ